MRRRLELNEALTKSCAALSLAVPLVPVSAMVPVNCNVAGSMCRAMVQLLLANIHTPSHHPVMVHTDLCDEWHILWMDGNTMWRYTPATRFEAVAMVEDILSTPVLAETGTSSPALGSEEIEGISRVLKRRRLSQPEGGNR